MHHTRVAAQGAGRIRRVLEVQGVVSGAGEPSPTATEMFRSSRSHWVGPSATVLLEDLEDFSEEPEEFEELEEFDELLEELEPDREDEFELF